MFSNEMTLFQLSKQNIYISQYSILKLPSHRENSTVNCKLIFNNYFYIHYVFNFQLLYKCLPHMVCKWNNDCALIPKTQTRN